MLVADGKKNSGGTTPELVLASTSPQRLAILQQLGLTVTTFPVDVDEQVSPGEKSVAVARRLAEAKCRAAQEDMEGHGSGTQKVTVAADTVVDINGEVLGKPDSRDSAASMLRQLSASAHTVVSGVAVGCAGRIAVAHSETTVRFAQLDADTIDSYLDIGEYKGKAGAYGIQGWGAVFVDRIEGNYHSVVGLPVNTLNRLCCEIGWPLSTWIGE